ncbi:arylesterase [Teredinibacter waterburyi]|jgi:Lysophospholipase L1 and related esterases|uniref:arylesterase n=1 Tax=Teredinibacter waterburyi TaxID=1500538 RepID=UPI00165F960E|nr:arylesterase [Teredinibacter waterburyi]
MISSLITTFTAVWLFFVRCRLLVFFSCAFTVAPLLNAEPDVVEGKRNILVVGDSLSAAYNLAVESGWVTLLEQRLATTPAYSDYVVFNASAGGATTAAGLQRLPSLVQQYRPYLMILELGANDGLQGKPVPYITSNLQKMIDIALAAKAKVLLVGTRLPPNLGARYTGPFFDQYSHLAEYNRVALVPFILDGVAGNSELMQADGLHPTAAGQPIVLQNIWSSLEALL